MKNKIEIFLCKALMVILPLHYFLFIILLKDFEVLKYTKDILITILFISSFLNKSKNASDKIAILLSIFILILGIYAIKSDYFDLAIYNARIYIEPIIVYFIFKKLKLSEKNIKALFDCLITTCILICIYGIFQSVVLGGSFLVKMGYPLFNGELSYVYRISGLSGFQRATGTLVYPNTFGFYLGLVLIIALNYSNVLKKKRRYKNIEIVIIIIALILTFSRSSWVGMTIVIVISHFYTKKKMKLSKLVITMMVINIISISYAIFYDYGIFAKITHYIQGTLSFEDTSMVGHLDSFEKSFLIMKNNIWGTGLGNNGPKAMRYLKNPILTESSYFLMIFETGIMGFISYYSIYCNILLAAIRQKKNKFLSNAVETNLIKIYITIFVLITFIFLPNIQDMEIIAYYFMLVGILSNSNLVSL